MIERLFGGRGSDPGRGKRTPPGQYLDDSVGKPLPGIECQRAPDGELLIRGPYVSPGYFGVDAQGNIQMRKAPGVVEIYARTEAG